MSWPDMQISRGNELFSEIELGLVHLNSLRHSSSLHRVCAGAHLHTGE